MIIQPITYADVFTGEEETKKFYFHLSKADLIKLLGITNGAEPEEYIKELAEGNSRKSSELIIEMFETIILNSVGERTPDGKFVKTKEFREEFQSSEAYGELFAKLVTDNKFAEKFITGMMGGPGSNQKSLQSVPNQEGPNRKRNKKKH